MSNSCKWNLERIITLPKIWIFGYLSITASWFQDNLFRRLMKNAGILLSGNVIAALFGLAAITLTARALGAELFGVFALIQAYVLVINSLVSFQSWQALIKYGAEALEQKRIDDFKRLVKFGTLLDAGTAILGTLIAVIVVFWFGRWQGWAQQTVHMTIFYSSLILFSLIGTPTAILRLFGRFKTFALQQVFVSSIRLLGVGFLYFFSSGLWGFLLLWMFSEILGCLILLGMTWIELYRQGYRGILSGKMGPVSLHFPGLWRFVWFSNINSSVKLVGREMDLLLVGAFIGLEASGLYKIAKYFAKVMAQIADPIDQSVYPDLARLWVDGSLKEFRSLILRIGTIAGCIGMICWLGFVVLGEQVIDLTVGAEYRAAYLPMVIYIAPFLLYMYGVGFRSAMLSMNQAGRVLQIHLVAYACYFSLLPFLLMRFELMGAAMAQVTFHSIWFVAMFFSVKVSLKKAAEER